MEGDEMEKEEEGKGSRRITSRSIDPWCLDTMGAMFSEGVTPATLWKPGVVMMRPCYVLNGLLRGRFFTFQTDQNMLGIESLTSTELILVSTLSFIFVFSCSVYSCLHFFLEKVPLKSFFPSLYCFLIRQKNL